MKLVYPELLIHDLETGIGELGLNYEMIPAEYRLRLPVSNVASLAITAALRDVGYEAMTIESRPMPGAVLDERHVFSLVQAEHTPPTIVDATYSSLLRLAGLTPEGVLTGQKDRYPSKKILTFEQGEVDMPAAALITSALETRESREFESLFHQQPHPFDAMSSWAIYRVFSEFWNPLHFQEYEPPKDVANTAKYLKGCIRHLSVLMDENESL